MRIQKRYFLAFLVLAACSVGATAAYARSDHGRASHRRKVASLKAVGVSARHAVARGRIVSLKIASKRKAKLTLTVLHKKAVVARGHRVVARSRRPRSVRVKVNHTLAGSSLELRVDAKVGHRHGRSTLPLRVRTSSSTGPGGHGRPGTLPQQRPGPPPGTGPGSGSGTGGSGPGTGSTGSDPYANGLCPARNYPQDEIAILKSLPPDGDADGDGFSNQVELDKLGFDPNGNPTQFNPLVADVPEIGTQIDPKIGLAVVDRLTDGSQKSVGTVNIDTTGSSRSTTDESSQSVTDSHTVSVEVGYSKGSFSEKASYSYTHSTTNESSVAVTSEQRQDASRQLSQTQQANQGATIDHGTMIVDATISNPGHVSYKVLTMTMEARQRSVDGSSTPYGDLKVDFDPASAPTLTPGQSKTVEFEMDGIGASDILSLTHDTSNMQFSITNYKLTEIGADGFQADTGDFAQYTDSITGNTGEVSIDYGDGSPIEHHLVSTTFLRDRQGFPAGTSLCDALSLVLGRKLTTAPIHVAGKPGTIDALTGLSKPDGATVGAGPTDNQYWITGATPDAVADPSLFGPQEVLLRAGRAVQLTLYRDHDGDGLSAEDEAALGTSDDKADTDGDGLSDYFETQTGWDVNAERVGAAAPPAIGSLPTYHVYSDPSSPDTDQDGLSDAAEYAAHSDPSNADTDDDANPDGKDPHPTQVSSQAEYTFDAPGPGPLGDTFADAFGNQPALNTCLGGARTMIADRNDVAGHAFNASNVSGSPCEVMNRANWPTSGAFAITAWVRIPDPGDRAVSRTWVAGVPGSIALELDVVHSHYGNSPPDRPYPSLQLAAVPAPCDAGATCGTPPPVPTVGTSYPYSTVGAYAMTTVGLQPFPFPGAVAPGSWHFVALSVWPGTNQGASGTWFEVRFDDPGATYATKDTEFVPATLPADSGCQLVVGSLTHDCVGTLHPYQVPQPQPLDGCDGFFDYETGVLPFFTQHCMTVEPPGLGIDDLQLFGTALDDNHLTRVKNLGY